MAIHILAHAETPPVLTLAQHGVPLDEVGINISKFIVRYYPEVNETIANYVGNTLWRVVSDTFSREIQCEGETLGSDGILAFTMASALTFANFKQDFLPSAGTFYMDEATVTASRNGWRSVSLKATARGTL